MAKPPFSTKWSARILFVLAVLIMLSAISTINYVLFHTVAELATVVVGWSIFVLLWNTRRFVEDPFFAIFAPSLLAVSALDLLHTLSYRGLEVVGGDPNAPTQLWVAARALQAVSLLAACLVLGRRPSPPWLAPFALVVSAAIASAFAASILLVPVFPTAYVDGAGLTPFKVLAEYAIVLLFLVSALLLWHRRAALAPEVAAPLLIGVLLLVPAELAFTAYLSVTGAANMLGHLLKLGAFAGLYYAFLEVGLARPAALLFRELAAREEANRVGREFLARLLQQAAVPMLTVDPDGVVLQANLAFARILGLSEDELAGRRFVDLFSLADRASLSGLLERAAVPGEGVELSLHSPHGEERVLVWSSAPVEANGAYPPAIIFQAQDVTRRKQAEAALAEANRKLALLSTVTRHDILNSMTALLGYLELAREDCPAGGDVATWLDRAMTAGHAIERKIEFTRLYETLGQEAPVWHSLAATVAVLPRSSVPVEADLDGFEVYADRMFGHVFENLLENTLRHAEGATRIRATARETEEGLLIVWEDDGPGVPADEKERIFQKGFGRHTGLGLFLIREILAITGITIAETGTPGKGARFELRVSRSAYRRA